MSTDISNAFIKQFERETHEAYQRMGSKLRATVRNKNNVVGASAIFPIVGKGAAQTKSRAGMVPTMNVSHSTVECFLSDYYAGDWVDRLDELKTDIDERQVLANAGAYALGRQTDTLIISSLSSTTNTAGTNADGLTIQKVMTAFQTLGNNDVPDDGERYAIVGWQQWAQLLEVPEFADADYVGSDELPFNGGQAKHWLGTTWMPFSGLPVSTSVRSCYWYHRTAIGFASGSDVQTDITWHGDRASHFVNSMSQGAVLIDGAGVVQLPCLES